MMKIQLQEVSGRCGVQATLWQNAHRLRCKGLIGEIAQGFDGNGKPACTMKIYRVVNTVDAWLPHTAA